jgi:hypothetical protein
MLKRIFLCLILVSTNCIPLGFRTYWDAGVGKFESWKIVSYALKMENTIKIGSNIECINGGNNSTYKATIKSISFKTKDSIFIKSMNEDYKNDTCRLDVEIKKSKIIKANLDILTTVEFKSKYDSTTILKEFKTTCKQYGRMWYVLDYMLD